MKIDVYVHADRDSMWSDGDALGLTGDALRHFSYTGYEVKLTFEVDAATGNTKIVAVDDRKVQD